MKEVEGRKKTYDEKELCHFKNLWWM